jgi:hypothetical protein
MPRANQGQHLGLAVGQAVEVLAGGGPGRAQAGAVPFPDHDDARPEKRVIRPVGPADLDHLCFHPV